VGKIALDKSVALVYNTKYDNKHTQDNILHTRMGSYYHSTTRSFTTTNNTL